MSEHTHLTVTHDYKKIPLATLGYAVIIHNKPVKQLTWAPHAVDSWYVGTSR